MNDRNVTKQFEVSPFDAALKRAQGSANNFCYGLITSFSIFELIKNEDIIKRNSTREELKFAKVEIERAWQQLAAHHVGEA